MVLRLLQYSCFCVRYYILQQHVLPNWHHCTILPMCTARVKHCRRLWSMPAASDSGVPRVGVFKPPAEIPKVLQNRAKLNPIVKTVKNCRIQHANTTGCSEKGSKILKLPSVRNCFTLEMASKLVVIINSLKSPKMKKILLYEMKFLVPIYSCLQNH